MPVCMTARYQVEPEMVEECKRTIEDFVKYIRINEPTTLFYMANQEMGRPTRFLHTMIFETEEAIAIHQKSPATKRFVFESLRGVAARLNHAPRLTMLRTC